MSKQGQKVYCPICEGELTLMLSMMGTGDSPKLARLAEANAKLEAEVGRLREALEGYECSCEREAAYAGLDARTYVCPRCDALEAPDADRG